MLQAMQMIASLLNVSLTVHHELTIH